MILSRWRAEQAELARIKAAEEAKVTRELQELRTRYPMLTEESIKFLHSMKSQYGLHIVSVLGAALVREHDQAIEQLLHMKHERHQVERRAMDLGRRLDFPAVEALDLEAGEPRWWVWIINNEHDLGPLFATFNTSAGPGFSGRYVTI